MRILLVEDDRSAARGITFQLQQHRMVVDVADCGAEALELARLYDYVAAIVDLMLPDMEGYEVVTKLRSSRIEAPVLMLSAVARTQAKVRGLSVGADDYLAKPFAMAELVARLNALIRRSNGVAKTELVFGDIRLDTAARAVSRAGQAVRLTALEYGMLSYLALHAGRPISKTELTEHLYAQDFDRDSNTLEVIVARLRRKLGDQLIETVRGQGYRLIPGNPAGPG